MKPVLKTALKAAFLAAVFMSAQPVLARDYNHADRTDSRMDRRDGRQDNRGDRHEEMRDNHDGRQDNRGDRRDGRQDNRGDRRDDRQDRREDHRTSLNPGEHRDAMRRVRSQH